MTRCAPRLVLLGRAELDCGDGRAPLRLRAERRYRLLVHLALRGAWVGRDELATLFWPNRPQAAARSNLRKLVLEVRALQLPLFESDRNGLRWAVATDLADFHAARASNDLDAALALALPLASGPALPGLDGGDSPAFSAWLDAERLRLHNAWRDTALAALPTRDAAGALHLARALLAADAFDEDAIVAALDAHRALADRAGAVDDFRRYADRLLQDLGVEPSLRVRAALDPAPAAGRRASDHTAPVAGVAPSGDGFIGRGDELLQLKALLAQPACRLLTVTGPGGMGKSRLVKEALRGLVPLPADGVLWIALDDLSDMAQVAPRIATELGLSVAPQQDTTDRVATALASRQTLLVLDNAEHLPRLAALIDRLLDAAPRLQLLATSRARIGVAREWLLPLAGLGADAVRLFVAQAQAADPRFDATANAPHIVPLMQALGGLPLAILLAASWVRLLPVSALTQEVALSLDVLEGAEEGEERPEHRSVRATFEQSWRRLVPAEQRALAALSVMVGSFSRSAATELAQAPLPLLAALADKSLLQVDEAGRFSLHPLIQQFAAGKLGQEPARTGTLRDRHAETFARFMNAYADFESVNQPAALAAISTELSNLLVAWNWAVTRPNLSVLQRCCSGLSNYFQARGPIGTGADLFARAQAAVLLHAATAQGAARHALWGIPIEHAALCYWLGEYDTAERCAHTALQAARDNAHAFGTRTSLNTLALVLMRKGRLDDAAVHLQEALTRAHSDKAAREIPAYAGNLVHIQRELGNEAAALRLAHQALVGHRANGHLIGEISMTNELGQLHHALGQLAQAVDWYEQGLKLAAGSGMELRRVQLLTHLASALLDMGLQSQAGDMGLPSQAEGSGALLRAAQVCGEALRVVVGSGLLAHEPTCRRTLANIAAAQGDSAQARLQLQGAIAAARRIDAPLVIAPVLRDCALWLERSGQTAAALHCLACADAHSVSKGNRLLRFKGQRERLCGLLDGREREGAEAAGAALSLQAGLDLAEEALASV